MSEIEKITIEFHQHKIEGLCDILERYQNEAKENPYLKHIKLAQAAEAYLKNILQRQGNQHV